MATCANCAAGRHWHDTFGPNAIEVHRGNRRVGDDAGCPFVIDGRGCTCGHVNPPRGGRQHPNCPTCTC